MKFANILASILLASSMTSCNWPTWLGGDKEESKPTEIEVVAEGLTAPSGGQSVRITPPTGWSGMDGYWLSPVADGAIGSPLGGSLTPEEPRQTTVSQRVTMIRESLGGDIVRTEDLVVQGHSARLQVVDRGTNGTAFILAWKEGEYTDAVVWRCFNNDLLPEVAASVKATLAQ